MSHKRRTFGTQQPLPPLAPKQFFGPDKPHEPAPTGSSPMFTQLDVARLRGLLGAFEPDDAVHSWLPDLADRIAALLPPMR